MKNKVYCISVLAILMSSILFAQSESRNHFQISTNLYYFKGIEVKFKPLNYFPFGMSYTRFLEDKPYSLSGSFAHYRFSDHNNPELKKRGDVQAKFFTVIGLQAGYRLSLTPKRSFLAKLGIAYRLGREDQFYSMIQVSPGRYETFGKRYKYRNLGFEFSAEQQFHLNPRWSLSLGGGYQYFLSRATTNHHLWLNVGAVYAF